MTASKLMHVDFEVFGNVQGVCFRAYTQDKAKSLGVHGWCRNTRRGTVDGELEGEANDIETMKKWLRIEGSPSSRIDKTIFKNEREIQDYSFSLPFSIKY